MLKIIPPLFILSIILSGCLRPLPSPPSTLSTTRQVEQTQSPTQSPQLGTLPTCETQSPALAEKNTSGKHALLIGIEKYNHPNIANLKGAVNDVKLIQQVLRERFGFQPNDFIILLDEQATHSCIENAFNSLIQRIQANDLVYIHYAGHGSQTADLNGDEQRGQDQTWVSFGSRQPGRENDKDNYDVLDDEINAWMAAIYTKTDQVIFVSDSCHSATVARGQAPISRGSAADKRPYPLGQKAYTKLEEYHGIHIGAARDQEFAAETLGDDNKFYGLFSWHWAKALQQANVGDTWNQIFKRTHALVVGKRGEAQRPQLEGDRHRKVFGGNFSPPVATVAVSSVNGEWIKIQAGVTASVTVGSTYRLHQQKESQARIEITKVGTFESEGKMTIAGAFQVGDLLVEENHAYHFKPFKVYLSADDPNGKDRPLLQAIQAAFQRSSELSGYALTNEPNNIDLRLQLLRPKRGKDGQALYEKDNDALPKSFPNQSPELWILTPDQHLLHKKLQIKFDEPSKGIQLLQYNLNHLARLREIKALQNSDRTTTKPVTVQTDILTPIKACPTGGDCINLPSLGWYHKKETSDLPEIGTHRLAKDDILSFTLHNQSRRSYYYYLINISPDGTLYAIYPDPEERMEYARVHAGEQRALIDEVVLILKSIGEQSLKLIATKRPMDVSLLQKDGFKGRIFSDLNPLEQLLVSAAHGQRGVIRLSNNEWVTKQVTFEVN